MPKLSATVLAVLALLLLPVAAAQAHTPDVATFEIASVDNTWMLSMHLPQVRVGQAMDAHFAGEAAPPPRERYQEALVAYMKASIALSTADGDAVELGAGGVRLGTHQTDLRFEIVGLPEPPPQHLEVRIASFAELGHQTQVLRVHTPDGQVRRAILNDDNEFTTQLALTSATTSTEHGHSHAGADPQLDAPWWARLVLAVGALAAAALWWHGRPRDAHSSTGSGPQ